MVTINVIGRCIKKWMKRLRFDPAWTIRYKIVSAKDMDENAEDALACVEISDYFSAEILFCQERLEAKALDEVVVHELLHIILHPVALALQDSMGKDHSQLLTNMMESTIERLVPGYLVRR